MDLLLEIGTEELPASAVYSGMTQIENSLPRLLREARLDHGAVKVSGTPRRLAVTVEGVSENTAPRTDRKKGPPLSAARDADGAWTRAAEGFAESQGCGVDELRVEETGKGSYVFAVTETPGEAASDILPGILAELVGSIRFKKSMRWGSGEVRFSRPVRWLLALADKQVISFSFAGLQSSNSTFGHRYLSPGPIIVPEPGAYEWMLEAEYVTVDNRRRRESITGSATGLLEEEGLTPVLEPDVLDEVVQLVEWPGVVTGSFNEEFLRLPREVLVHAMEEHQRYFPVEGPGGELAARFLAVHNGDHNQADTIRKGHERVLAARLADAEFFYSEDLARPLSDRMGDLEHVIYQSELGSMAEKSERLARTIEITSEGLDLSDETVERALRAARLSKCDLVTHVVIEFPALQGTMGSIYAEAEGEDPAVAGAIADQYRPRRMGDELPSTMEGALLSLAEKADNLAASFGLGHVPTGSEDPYGLRRQALGMIQIILDMGLLVSMTGMVRAAATELESEAHGFAWSSENEEAFREFMVSRETVFFTDKGYRYDLVDAALELDWDHPASARDRLDALTAARDSGLLSRLYTGFERCYNLSKGQQTVEVKPELFSEEVERQVFELARSSAEGLDRALGEKDFEGALGVLEPLCAPIDRLFDEVLIMAEDPEVRSNRLSLLALLVLVFDRVADFARFTWD